MERMDRASVNAKWVAIAEQALQANVARLPELQALDQSKKANADMVAETEAKIVKYTEIIAARKAA